ncbi:PEP-CTERM sorting domain-containing protein [Luteolibacter marinus]|uniref:PEP-CTERM sorting domain-containing protein n=1 Tax=Luteolibacter marinus TaxID=2776705 RepID=UPI00186720FC|nr:PEP-CTERM sorting domain-containing protein [Luteolibacter marinus]
MRFLLTLTLAAIAPATGAVSTYSNSWTVNTTLADNDPAGWASSVFINDVPFEQIGTLEVDLVISGGWNGDLYAYVTHKNGFSVLLNRIGATSLDGAGSSSSGMNVTFSSSATEDIHTYAAGVFSGSLSGIFLPDGREADPMAVTQFTPQTALLSSFHGQEANGLWTLFVADMAHGDLSTVVSWGITITEVPEPARVLAAGIPVLLGTALLGHRRRPRTQSECN